MSDYFQRAALIYAKNKGIDLGNHHDGRQQRIDEIIARLQDLDHMRYALESALRTK